MVRRNIPAVRRGCAMRMDVTALGGMPLDLPASARIWQNNGRSGEPLRGHGEQAATVAAPAS